MDGIPLNDEAHQEGDYYVYIHEEIKIYSNRAIGTSDTSIARYCNN